MEKRKAIALFSGGLDSMLSVLWMKKLNFEIIPVFFKSYFYNEAKAEPICKSIGLTLQVVDISEQMISVIKNPKYGFGKNMNPCIDCHALMFREAGKLLHDFHASFLLSGEVLGQRPMSQRLDSMNAVAKYSSYKDLIIRPLSQKLLKDTLPIKKGWVNKDDMLDIQGRSRKRQMELAEYFGIQEYHNPGGGCSLTEKSFSVRLADLVKYDSLEPSYVETLHYGRHFRISNNMKLIVGRNEKDNTQLSEYSTKTIQLRVSNHQGPLGLLYIKGSDYSDNVDKLDELNVTNNVRIAASIFLSFANRADQIDQVKAIFPNGSVSVLTTSKINRCEYENYWIYTNR